VSVARPLALLILAVSSTFCGCADVNTRYGFVEDDSLNGTGVLAQALRERGAEVRSTRRLNKEVSAWAETIVRFAPYSGPISQDEARWYGEWLSSSSSHRLIYIPNDFDATSEYWDELIANLPPKSDSTKSRYEAAKARTTAWRTEFLRAPEKRDRSEHWFDVESKDGEVVAKSLKGPWAKGVDSSKAAIPRRDFLKVRSETVLLSSDDKPLAIDWTTLSGSTVLIIVNGSFLLNEPLTRAARRPLAERVLDWVGDQPTHVAFVEGWGPASDQPEPSMFDLFWIEPLGWISVHILALGLLGVLALAVRLGRPRGEPPSGADRPVAHAEALGDLLIRTRDVEAARAQLEAYRRWRHPSSAARTRGRDPSARA
jgi:hypothetical protein